MISEKQRRLFELLAESEELIFACGPKGVVVNLVGRFKIAQQNGDDILEVGDGTDHVHINWSRVKRFVVGDFHGEGMLNFFDGDEYLFRFYNPAGAFPAEIVELAESELV